MSTDPSNIPPEEAPAPAPVPDIETGREGSDEASERLGVRSFGSSVEESKSEIYDPTTLVSGNLNPAQQTRVSTGTQMNPDEPSFFGQTAPPVSAPTQMNPPFPGQSNPAFDPTMTGPPPMQPMQLPFTMVKPIMGDYIDPNMKNCVVVGGKPNHLWTGLVDFPRDNPTCHRTIGHKSKDDGFVVRSTPPPTLKFTKKCDLFVMLPKLILFTRLHGLDTVLYINNPLNPTEMLFIPHDHAHLKFEVVKRQALFLMNHKWDRYDRQNNSALRELLVSACDKELEQIIMPLILREELPAAAILQKICSEVDFKNSLSWEVDREKLKKMKLSDHPGLNVQKFCEKISPILIQLENANELNVPVMTWLLNAFIDTDIKNFSGPFYQKYFSAFIQVADRSGDRTCAELMETLRGFGLHWSDILEYATHEYKTLLYANKWSAAHVPKDSGAVPSFNLTEFDSNPALKKKVAALIAAEGKKEKDKGKDKGKNEKDDKNKKPKRFLNDPPPKDGEKKYKIVKNAIYIFCPHCRQGKGSWQRTHTGEMHGQQKTSLTEEQLKKFAQLAKEKKEIPELNFCEEVEGSSGITL